jgi:hypothetical protein
MFFARPLRWALVISVVVHVVLLLAGRDYWSEWLDQEDLDSAIAVQILPPSAPPKPPPPLKPPKSPKPVVKPTPSATAAPAVPASSMPATEGNDMPVAPAGPVKADPTLAGPALQPGRALPSSGRMRFAVTKGDAGFIVGRAVHDWKVEGGRYELKSVIETTGIVSLFADIRLGQLSSGRIDTEGLHPETFRDNRKDGQYHSEFDWAQGTLKLGNGTVMPLAPGAQDLLSMFYQFALYPLDGPEVSLMVTTGRKFERYVFRIEADVPLLLNRQTDDYPIATYHLSYRGREAEGVDVWLARDMERLPVKIRYTDRKGGVTEMLAEQIDYPGKR